jgi:integrase
MAVGKKRANAWPVHVYDWHKKRNVYVGSRPTKREAEQLFRDERDRLADLKRCSRRQGGSTMTCDQLAAAWTATYPRSEQTNKHNRERIRKFGEDFKGRPLDSITRPEARVWALDHRGRLPVVRAMFNDALNDGLCTTNPFAKLNLKQSCGAASKSPVNVQELYELADLALDCHGDAYGPTFRALILVTAWTGMREGETFAIRWSDITGDILNGQRQFNSRLGRETPPKHNSTGPVALLPPAQEALKTVPRRPDDDLVFRSKYGKQFRQTTLHEYWKVVRAAFGRPDLAFHSLRHFCGTYLTNELLVQPWMTAKQLRHQDGGRLVTELYGHPSRQVALDEIRRGFEQQQIRAAAA